MLRRVVDGVLGDAEGEDPEVAPHVGGRAVEAAKRARVWPVHGAEEVPRDHAVGGEVVLGESRMNSSVSSGRGTRSSSKASTMMMS